MRTPNPSALEKRKAVAKAILEVGTSFTLDTIVKKLNKTQSYAVVNFSADYFANEGLLVKSKILIKREKNRVHANLYNPVLRENWQEDWHEFINNDPAKPRFDYDASVFAQNIFAKMGQPHA
jgi:hypothetical protein